MDGPMIRTWWHVGGKHSTALAADLGEEKKPSYLWETFAITRLPLMLQTPTATRMGERHLHWGLPLSRRSYSTSALSTASAVTRPSWKCTDDTGPPAKILIVLNLQYYS